MSEFLELLHSPGHWLFEIFLMVLFDGIILGILWPYIKHYKQDHKEFHMPYKSSAQRAYMHAKLPQIAAKWDKEHNTPKKLPKHVKNKK